MEDSVVFIIDRLPYNSDLSRISTRRVSEAVLHETYQRCLQLILQSPICMAGKVPVVYFHYGDHWYEMKGCADDWGTPSAFNDVLRNLHSSGMIVNQADEVTWSEISGLSALLESLPPHSLNIGLLTGPEAQGLQNVQSFIDEAPENQTFVFVVGDFGDTMIQQYINAYVNVSGYQLSPEAALTSACNALARKWSIQ